MAAETKAQKLWNQVKKLPPDPDAHEDPESVQSRYSTAWAATCSLRAKALARAREFYGREVFDHLLYTTTARSFSKSGNYGPEARAALLRRERGCVDAQ